MIGDEQRGDDEGLAHRLRPGAGRVAARGRRTESAQPIAGPRATARKIAGREAVAEDEREERAVASALEHRRSSQDRAVRDEHQAVSRPPVAPPTNAERDLEVVRDDERSGDRPQLGRISLRPARGGAAGPRRYRRRGTSGRGPARCVTSHGIATKRRSREELRAGRGSSRRSRPARNGCARRRALRRGDEVVELRAASLGNRAARSRSPVAARWNCRPRAPRPREAPTGPARARRSPRAPSAAILRRSGRSTGPRRAWMPPMAVSLGDRGRDPTTSYSGTTLPVGNRGFAALVDAGVALLIITRSASRTQSAAFRLTGVIVLSALVLVLAYFTLASGSGTGGRSASEPSASGHRRRRIAPRLPRCVAQPRAAGGPGFYGVGALAILSPLAAARRPGGWNVRRPRAAARAGRLALRTVTPLGAPREPASQRLQRLVREFVARRRASSRDRARGRRRSRRGSATVLDERIADDTELIARSRELPRRAIGPRSPPGRDACGI